MAATDDGGEPQGEGERSDNTAGANQRSRHMKKKMFKKCTC